MVRKLAKTHSRRSQQGANENQTQIDLFGRENGQIFDSPDTFVYCATWDAFTHRTKFIPEEIQMANQSKVSKKVQRIGYVIVDDRKGQVKLAKEFDSAIIGRAYPAWNQWMEDGWEAFVYDIGKVDDILNKPEPPEDINDVMRDLREVPVGKRPIFVHTWVRS